MWSEFEPNSLRPVGVSFVATGSVLGVEDLD
jgi:hypothetical protein